MLFSCVHFALNYVENMNTKKVCAYKQAFTVPGQNILLEIRDIFDDFISYYISDHEISEENNVFEEKIKV